MSHELVVLKKKMKGSYVVLTVARYYWQYRGVATPIHITGSMLQLQ